MCRGQLLLLTFIIVLMMTLLCFQIVAAMMNGNAGEPLSMDSLSQELFSAPTPHSALESQTPVNRTIAEDRRGTRNLAPASLHFDTSGKKNKSDDSDVVSKDVEQPFKDGQQKLKASKQGFDGGYDDENDTLYGEAGSPVTLVQQQADDPANGSLDFWRGGLHSHAGLAAGQPSSSRTEADGRSLYLDQEQEDASVQNPVAAFGKSFISSLYTLVSFRCA
jgi:hypothetical protein